MAPLTLCLVVFECSAKTNKSGDSGEVSGALRIIPALSTQIRGSDKANARELHIAYRYGEHYDSVRSVHDNTEAPAQLQTEVTVTGRKIVSAETTDNTVCKPLPNPLLTLQPPPPPLYLHVSSTFAHPELLVHE